MTGPNTATQFIEQQLAQGKKPNHLIDQQSPYLLQHAFNPVDWLPWGEEAFTRARQADKPIFLSVGYSTCHWCHVMARESFADQQAAAILNEHFIAVKVDREERPDVDHLYMTAAQAMGGGGGSLRPGGRRISSPTCCGICRLQRGPSIPPKTPTAQTRQIRKSMARDCFTSGPKRRDGSGPGACRRPGKTVCRPHRQLGGGHEPAAPGRFHRQPKMAGHGRNHHHGL